MQTLKSFQEFQEDLNVFGHDKPLPPKKQKKLEGDKGVFKDFDIEGWKSRPFPANDSEEVIKELRILQSMVADRDMEVAREFMFEVDKKIKAPFKRYFKQNDLDLNLIDDAKKIIDDASPIILELKQSYNRIRPYALASKLNFERKLAFTISPLKSANSPSYPSGHATQGRLMAKYLASKVDLRHRMDIMKLGDYVGQSRMLGGVHYPSDTDFGKQLADSLFNYLTVNKESFKMNSFKQLSEGMIMEVAGGLAGSSLFDRDNKERFIKLTDSGKLVDTQGSELSVDKSLWKIMKKQLQDAESWDELKPQWTNFKSAFGVSLGSVAKGLNDMSGGKGGGKGPSGEDWEAMIVLGQFKKGDKNFVGTPEWDRIEPKGFWDDDYNRETALKLADAFDDAGFPNMYQTGSGKGGVPLTKNWKEWGGTNATPKTDLKSAERRISLKKKGGSQVMSAKKFEAAATFEAAKVIMGENHPKEASDMVDTMQKMVLAFDEKIDKKLGVVDAKTGAYKGGVDDLEKSKSKDPITIAHKKKMAEIRKNGRELDKKMSALFMKNPKFKQSFVFEAATGQQKFGDASSSRADVMIEFDVNKQKINLNQPLKTLNDVEKLATKYALYFAFKSTGGSSPYMSLRGNVYDNPDKALAKQKKMLSNSHEPMTLNGILTEGLKQEDVGRKVLHEGYVEQLDEWGMLDKVKKGLSSIAKKVRDKFQKMWKWMKDKINASFDWIKKQGKKMLSALQQFFGKVLDKCNLTPKSGAPELFSEKA